MIAPQLVDKHTSAHSQGHLEKNHSRFSPQSVSAARSNSSATGSVPEGGGGALGSPAVPQEAKLGALPVTSVCLDFSQRQRSVRGLYHPGPGVTTKPDLNSG